MAGVCYDGTLNEAKQVVIAGNKVTNITHETAQVGCTKVTRAEAEALIAEMNKVPSVTPFLQPGPEYPEYVGFTLSDKQSGWLSASEKVNGGGFEILHSVSLCLTNEKAEQLLKFLTKQLGYVSHKLSQTSPGAATTKPRKWVIEYTYRNKPWERTGNSDAHGEFDSFETAAEMARQQEKEMGSGYQYRAVELR